MWRDTEAKAVILPQRRVTVSFHDIRVILERVHFLGHTTAKAGSPAETWVWGTHQKCSASGLWVVRRYEKSDNEDVTVIKPRILVVEDDEFTGSLITSALAHEGFETMLASSALAAKDALKDFDPDAVLVDIDLGEGPNGIEFVQFVHKSRPDIAQILLSKFGDTVSAGARDARIPDGVAYLRKSVIQSTEGLVDAIREAMRGRTKALRHDKTDGGLLKTLTKSQREILQMMAQGLSNKEIALQRKVSLSSVEQLVAGVFRAFNLTKDDKVVPRVEAIRIFVAESGLPKRPGE
jgi:DNA-binding NarL/FixJ family response regulator